MIASLELSKTLFELSGWSGDTNISSQHYPLYDLGYLLRKLPGQVVLTQSHEEREAINRWSCAYMPELFQAMNYIEKADTPENAACKLAIELFKAGILIKEVL